MDYKALGYRIRQQRKLLNMTQEDLAAASNVSASYIGHIERGIKHCSLETVIDICNALNVTPDVLLKDSLGIDEVQSNEDLSSAGRSLLNDIANILRERDYL